MIDIDQIFRYVYISILFIEIALILSVVRRSHSNDQEVINQRLQLQRQSSSRRQSWVSLGHVMFGI